MLDCRSTQINSEHNCFTHCCLACC